MKIRSPLILIFAVATALSFTACDRPETPDVDTTATPAPEPAPPAAMPEPTTPEPATVPEPTPPAPTTAATPTDSGKSFAELDKNGDGGVSRDELADTEMLHQHFSEADTDKNGKLSSAEVEKHRADMAAMPGE